MTGLLSTGQSARPLVVFLMGPTACGKTDLAIALHELLPVELISVDSALVYRGLDIGSAKPAADLLSRVPHRLIDIRDPAQPYSAASFRSDAIREIDAIHQSGRIPLLVGGTMLYFKALAEGLAEMPAANPELRAAIERDAETHGWPYIHSELAAVDPQTAAQIHPNHSQRICRALEVYRASGKTMTYWRSRQAMQEHSLGERTNLVQIGLWPQSRVLLHRRIERRFHSMLEAGFVEEVRALRARGDLSSDLPAIRAVGYRQAWDYLDGLYDYSEMVERGIVATRQLAKRQMTWLRKWPGLKRVSVDDNSGETRKISELAREILSFLSVSSL